MEDMTIIDSVIWVRKPKCKNLVTGLKVTQNIQAIYGLNTSVFTGLIHFGGFHSLVFQHIKVPL